MRAKKRQDHAVHSLKIGNVNVTDHEKFECMSKFCGKLITSLLGFKTFIEKTRNLLHQNGQNKQVPVSIPRLPLACASCGSHFCHNYRFRLTCTDYKV